MRAKFMEKLRKCFYGIKTGSVIIFEKPDGVTVERSTFSPVTVIFDYDEIVDENDGILKIVKKFYPQDGKHFFYVHRKDIVEGAM